MVLVPRKAYSFKTNLGRVILIEIDHSVPGEPAR